MRHLIGIIADDLTGANDSGVQLTEKGINTSVLFDIPTNQDNLDSGIVIDTNSRALSKEEATIVTKKASLFLKEANYEHIYKKMDSTLRGHIGTELQVIHDVFQPEFIVIAPAFPAYGRTTKNGIHYVNGTKLADTEAAKDPKHPVRESSIPKLIQDEIEQPVGILRIADMEAEVFDKKIREFREEAVKYIVCDADTQEDLKLAAQQLVSISDRIIWAGSAGLAEVLPDVLGMKEHTGGHPFSTSKRVMTVCGSLSKVTQNQVKYATEQPGVTVVELDTLQMFTDAWESRRQAYSQDCIDGLQQGNDVVLYVPSHEQIREQVKQLGKELQLSGNEIGERISDSIGQVVADVATNNQELSGFVLTGGDTAKDTSRHLGGIGFRLIKQVEAGIPLGTLIGTNREFTVITKAGAFGKEDSIYYAMQALKGDHNND